MIDPQRLRPAPIARRTPRVHRSSIRRALAVAAAALTPVLAVLAVAAAVTAVAAVRIAGPSGIVHAQTDPLAHAVWTALPGDAALGGHGAIIDGQSMTLIGGEKGDFEPPEALRALSLAAPETWTTQAEAGDRPQSALSGRGLVGARAVRVSPDASPTTTALVVCHCIGATTFSAQWPAAGNGVTWRGVAAAQPLPLANGLLAFDAPRGRVIAAGGELGGSGDIMTATWSLDTGDLNDAEWQPLPAVPFQLIFQAADRDPRSGHLVAFGGQGPDASPTAHLWRADLAGIGAPGAWSDAAALGDGGPSARSGATLTFAGTSGWAILYGGYAPEAGELSDLWALDYRDPSAPSWHVVVPSGASPGARSGQSAVWDAARNRVLYYGGLRLEGNGIRYLSDGFALDLTPDVAPTATTPAPSATSPVPTTPPAATTVGPSPTTVGPSPGTPTTPSPEGGRIFLPLSLRTADVRAAP